MNRDLDARLAHLEAQRDDTGPVRGVSGVLVACARLRADRLARGISDEEHEAEMARLPKSQWYVNIQAAMAGHRQERQEWQP